ncbi:MAG: hypothetical protein AABZ33_13045 [Chloroflexota bacterium]
MTELTRVPAPGSPFGRWSAAFGGLLVVAVVALATEPWGNTRTPADPTASPYQARSSSIRTAPGQGTAGPTLAVRTYRPDAFGPMPPGPAWAIRTPERVTPVPSVDLDDPVDVASGPVVDLGTADEFDAIVISGPPGATLVTIRLWRFNERGPPERQDLARLASPWPNASAWAVGLRLPGTPAGQVLAWKSGLYRLDLLVGPAGRIRMVMLSVRSVGEPDLTVALGPSDTDRLADSGFRNSILRRLPAAANLWTVGEILTGWARPSAAGDCQVAQIWRARDPDADCWPVPIGPTTALGVNLPVGQRITAITLTEVDPLPGPVALRSDLAVGGRPGLAALQIPGGRLPDGIYRLTVRVAVGSDRHWYVEVGPEGRRAAAINAFVTGSQR